ncbi:MAG: hypothetical protein IIV99_05875, partial [Oscillospiraceae bacterium]|nr:hypothetical protein [Oscillospiraceae bacterium]
EETERAVNEPLSTVSDDVGKVFDETPEGVELFSKVLKLINTATEYNATISILDIVNADWRRFEGIVKEVIIDKLKEKENAPENIDVFKK